MDKYREMRRQAGAARGTIDGEIKFFRAAYRLAAKRKKIPADVLPGEFYQVNQVNPRRISSDDEFESILEHTVEQGLSDEIIRRSTGHKSLEAYQRYVKLDPHVVMRLVEGGQTKTDKNGTKSLSAL